MTSSARQVIDLHNSEQHADKRALDLRHCGSMQSTCFFMLPALLAVSLLSLTTLFLGTEARGLGTFRYPANNQTSTPSLLQASCNS